MRSVKTLISEMMKITEIARIEGLLFELIKEEMLSLLLLPSIFNCEQEIELTFNCQKVKIQKR